MRFEVLHVWLHVYVYAYVYALVFIDVLQSLCICMYMYIYIYAYACTCLCLRTENRSRKTHVFEYRDCGVGWGGMVTFLVLRTWYIAMLLRSLGSFTTLHVATLLLGWGGVGGHVNVPCTSYMKYCYTAEISGIVYYVTCCYAAESGIWWKSQFPATWVPKVTSWWCMRELGNGDAFTRMLTASW